MEINTQFIKKKIPKQPPEKDDGNKEYKRFLIKHPKNTFERFIEKRGTQMLYRLIEGEGKAIYLFGVEDNGEINEMNKKQLESTLFYLKKISSSISAKIKNIRVYVGEKGYVSSARIELPYKIFSRIIENINTQ